MAWIAISHETPFKDEVLRVAKRLKVSRREAFAMIVEFWIYVDDHVDATASLGSRELFDLVEGTRLEMPFFEALIEAGWLVKNSAGLSIPNADDWLSKSAKSRLQKNKRQQRWRDGKRDVDSKTSNDVDGQKNSNVDGRATLQKRREQNTNTNTPPIVPQEKVTEELQNLGHWWNRLKAAGLVPAGVNAASPSEAVRKGWAKCQRIPELRALIQDLDRLEAEIRLADICREGWFRLEKLLGAKNRAGAFIVEVLAEGGYRTSRKGSGQLDFSAIGGGEYVGPE